MPWRDLACRGVRERAVAPRSCALGHEHNSGVLIYLLVAEHAIESPTAASPRASGSRVAADRDGMRERFVADDYERGVIDGVNARQRHAGSTFPTMARPRNELADAPVVPGHPVAKRCRKILGGADRRQAARKSHGRRTPRHPRRAFVVARFRAFVAGSE
jgi:hypothetical protein